MPVLSIPPGVGCGPIVFVLPRWNGDSIFVWGMRLRVKCYLFISKTVQPITIRFFKKRRINFDKIYMGSNLTYDLSKFEFIHLIQFKMSATKNSLAFVTCYSRSESLWVPNIINWYVISHLVVERSREPWFMIQMSSIHFFFIFFGNIFWWNLFE